MAKARVWAVNDGEKVFKNDFRDPSHFGNSAWDGREIHLFAGANETVAFQVIFENGARDALGLSLRIAGLESMRAEAFWQHYLYVARDRISPPGWFYAEGARPKRFGWVPDALIPMAADRPFDVSAGESQGLWVDLYVPRGVPKGVYRGAAELRSREGLIASLPIRLTVYGVELTDDLRRINMVYVGDVSEYYLEGARGAIRDEYRKAARAHGFDLVGSREHSMPFDRAALDRYHDRYLRDGDNLFTPKHGYDGWGRGRGERVFPIGMYGGQVLGDDAASIAREGAKWADWFRDKDWKGNYFWYICDEPKPERYPFVMERAGALKRAGVRLPIYTTAAYNPDLAGYIDHWSTGLGVRLADRDAHPECEFSFYNGYSPAVPMVNIDGGAAEFRATQWLKERYDFELYFYWEGTHWRHNHHGPRAGARLNVWQDPITFINYDEEVADRSGENYRRVVYVNGDGTLFYPGREPFFPESDLGYDLPIGSVRMKNLRRGAQDAAYIQMARDGGLAERVESIVRRAVPVGMSEANLLQPPSWSSVGSDWDGYRLELMRLLDSEG